MDTSNPAIQSADMASHISGLVVAVLRYFKARAVLASIEAKAAGMQYGVAAALAVGALFLVALGYVFFVIALVFAISAAFESEYAWIAVMGIAALLHIGGAVALIHVARQRFRSSPFPETLAELEKDQKWIKQLTTAES